MDYGLLGGLAEGLKSGLQSYQTERNYQDKKNQDAIDREEKKKQQAIANALSKRHQEIAELSSGVQENSQTGLLEKTPDQKRKEAMEEAYKQANLAKVGYTANYDEKTGRANLVRDPNFKTEEQRKIESENRAEARKEKSDLVKNAIELRKEYLGLPGTKQIQDVSAAYEKIKNSVKEPSAAGDMALIYGFMKLNDPGSTVREGEFATAQNAGSVPDRVRAMYNKVISGERLTPEQRNDFIKQSGNLYKAQYQAQTPLQNRYTELSKRMGIDPQDVILPFNPPDEPKGLIQHKSGGLLPNAQAASLPESYSNKVKVSNGKETLYIDPSDLKSAQSDGFQVVK